MTSLSLTQPTELSQLYTLWRFLQKRNFLERWKTKVSSRDIHVTFFVHAEIFLSINLA